MTNAGHVHLTAIPLETGAVEREAAVKAAVEAERQRKLSQADVTRAVKGVKAADAEVRKVEVTRDKVTIEVGKAEHGNGLDTDDILARLE
jgi:hypothetical protein